MQLTINEVFNKIEQIDGLLKVMNVGTTITQVDREIISELLDDYREILLNAKVKI